MNNSWKRFLSLLLALVMILSLGVTGFADEGNAEAASDQTAEEKLAETEEDPESEKTDTPEGQALEMEDLDPEKLQVSRLGIQEDVDLGEIVPMDEEDLNTVVRASIFLDAPATLAAGYAAKGVGTNSAAISYRDGLRAGQNAMTAQIEGVIGHELNVHWNLTLAANAISADLTLAEMAKVSAIPGVRSVERENLYLPMDDGEIVDPNTANTSEFMVGATDAWAAHYTGAGSRIAIIDTGIDTTHQSFADAGFLHAIEETGTADELMTVSDINAVLGQLNVKQRVSSITASQLNGGRSKIVYGFNYIDGNTTIDHLSDTEGEHGSHVAGIAAANRYIQKGSGWSDAAESVFAVGMAPDAQLLVMKVFGATRGGGAYDSDYMAAIEDAIVLGADACNLSLGSGAPGFTFAGGYQEILNNLADPSKNPDMVVAISAGNASDLAAELPLGSLYSEDVSMHTGGSPGSFVNSLCVSAADNVGSVGAPLTFNGSQNVFYTETSSSGAAMASLAGSTSYSYVYIDAVGETEDYSAVNSALSLSGKIVIVNRGGISFYVKGNNAKNYNPKALLIANNQPGAIAMGLDDYTGTFPVVSITQVDAAAIKENSAKHTTGSYTYYTGTVTVSNVVVSEATVKREDALIADFSSWGVPGSLLMKPEITAPGGNIYSVFGTNKTDSGTAGGSDQYELMSGTSMAAPHIAGLSAVLAEYLREDNPANHNNDLQGYSTRAISQSLMMSTATAMAPYGEYLPILQQGAGLANVYDAINSGSIIMMDPNNSGLTGKTGAASDGKVKVELGDDPAREGDYSFGFTVFNLTDEDVHYKVNTDVFTQALDGEFMSRGTSMLGASATCWWAPMSGTDVPNLYDVNMDGRTDSNDATAILDYVSGEKEEDEVDLSVADLDGDELISSLDAYLLLSYLEEQESDLPSGVVPAHSSRYCAVRITLPDAVKANLNDRYPGGAYIEGFTYVRSDSETRDGAVLNDLHSIPILGFYGSWTDAAMFDTTSYVEKLYGSDQEAYTGNDPTNYVTLLQGGKTVKFSGNPYTVEESFPADKLALNSNTTVDSITYNLIRSAGTTAFAVSKLDEDGLVTEVPAVSMVGYDVTGIWFYDYQGVWQNLGSNTYSVNKTPSAFGLQEGDRFRLGFYAIPEYNAMLVNNSYNAADSGNLYQDRLETLLKSNTLGKGAFVGYDFVIDDTAPEVKSAVLNGDQLSFTVEDDRALAYVAVMSLNGSVVYAEAVPGTNTYSLSIDATDAIANAQGYVAVFAGDYAGNESANAVKVNDNTSEEKTVYVLTDSLTAGEDYLLVNTSATGKGYALSYTSGTSGNTVTADEIKIEAGIEETGNKPFIDSEEVEAASVWSASGSTYLLNGNNYLRRNGRNSTTLNISTTNSYNAWQYSGGQLKFTDRDTYLRYYNNSFSLSSSASSICLFQKTVIQTEVDPNAVDSVTLDNYSLTLYKGNTVRLSAQVQPLTVEDQSIVWSSSDPSIATVDENGLVTVVWDGVGYDYVTITATSHADGSKFAECTVKVMAVDKALNAVIWDEAGEVFFSEFNTRSLPAWTKLHDEGQSDALHSTVYQNGTLFALSLNGETSTAYSVSSSYGLTELGNFSYPASDLAPGPSNVTLNDGTKLNLVVQAYGPYLLVSEVQNLDDGVNTYGGQEMNDTDTYIAGVAAITVTRYGGTYYFLDETGKVWRTELTLNGEFSFSNPTLVVDTGISTSFTYQSLYYDKNYLYWSHQADNISELIIIVPSTGEVVHAGNFGDGVWPAAGLYVKDKVAPAGVDDSSDGVLIPMDMSFIDSERINARYMAQLYGAPLPEENEPETPADEGGVEEGGSIAIIEPVEENEPILEPVPAEDGQDSAYTGSLMAFRGYRGTAPTVRATEVQTEDDGVITLEIAQRLASHNGMIAVDFDPALVSFLDAEDCESASNLSVHYDEKGVVTIAYANKSEAGDEIAADVPIVKLRFAVADESALQCGELANITTLERNEELELDEQTDVTIPGSTGHDWGDPTWVWAEDFSDAEANFVCRNNPAHTASIVAEVTSKTVDGVTTYTATALFQGKTYTDIKTDGKPPAAIIKSTTVMFDGKIHLRFSFLVPQEFLDLEGAYVSFDVKGEEVQRTLLTEGSAGDGGVTMFYLPVLIPEFADMVTVKFHDADGTVLRIENSRGEDYTNRVIYSAKTYAERMMANGKTEKDRQLAKGLYDYGTAAQIFFKYGDWEDLVLDSAVTDLERADFAEYKPATTGTKPDGFTSGGMRLYYESDNTLRISFKLDGSHPASYYQFKLDGKSIKVKSKSAQECYYDIKNIPGPELSKKHQISISDGTNTYSLSISALGYAYNIAGHEDVNEQNLAKALYLYAMATEAFFS